MTERIAVALEQAAEYILVHGKPKGRKMHGDAGQKCLAVVLSDIKYPAHALAELDFLFRFTGERSLVDWQAELSPRDLFMQLRKAARAARGWELTQNSVENVKE